MSERSQIWDGTQWVGMTSGVTDKDYLPLSGGTVHGHLILSPQTVEALTFDRFDSMGVWNLGDNSVGEFAIRHDMSPLLVVSNGRIGFGAPLRAPDGSSTTPSFSFTNAVTSGMYYNTAAKSVRIAADGKFEAEFAGGQIRVGTGETASPGFAFQASSGSGMWYLGGEGLRFSTSGVFQLELGGGQVRAPIGTTGAPSLSFQSKKDTGFYLASGKLRAAHGGVMAAEFADGTIRAPNGTLSNPSFAFQTNPAYGMFRDGAYVVLSTDGAEALKAGAAAVFMPGAYASTTSIASNVYVGTDGRLFRSTAATATEDYVNSLVLKLTGQIKALEQKVADLEAQIDGS